MPTRCMNKVQLLGNITRDPELRYTPGGMGVTSFGLATNRVWTTKQGEKKEDAQYHRIVAWNKLAELCAQLLKKGTRVFVEGRLQYREMVDQTGNKRQIAEIVIEDMIILSPKVQGAQAATADYTDETDQHAAAPAMAPTAETVGNLEDIVISDEDMPVTTPVDAPKEEMPF